jgi:hypothetical protein
MREVVQLIAMELKVVQGLEAAEGGGEGGQGIAREVEVR